MRFEGLVGDVDFFAGLFGYATLSEVAGLAAAEEDSFVEDAHGEVRVVLRCWYLCVGVCGGWVDCIGVSSR